MKYKVKFKKPKAMPSYKVCFDPKTGSILSITNKEVSAQQNYFVAPIHEVEGFINGNLNMTKHRVIFDVKKQEYRIVSNSEKIIVNADDLIFKLSTNSNAEIIVQQCIESKKWKLFASDKTKNSMSVAGSRIEEGLFFSITEYGNPNILYNHFYVKIKDLIETDFSEFPFCSQEESELDCVSVYTNRKFNKYSHEVVNE